MTQTNTRSLDEVVSPRHLARSVGGLAQRVYAPIMVALLAQVKNGRLLLDEPTSLPDGAQVQLEVVDGDDLDDDERKALHRSIDESITDEDAGNVEDLAQIIAELRASP